MSDSVSAVYELREAAVEHGKAIAESDRSPSVIARDRLLDTHLDLESKTAAALDECAESAHDAAVTALAETA